MKKKRYIHRAKRIMEPKLKMYSIKHFGTLKEGWVNFWFWNVYVKKAFWRYFLPIKSKKKKKKTAKSGEEIPYTTTEKSKHIMANSLVHY